MWLITNLMEKAFMGSIPSIENRRIEMFHANTDSDTKTRIMEDFTLTSSNIKVLISTVAFGMGVNIRDVDLVVHWGLPTSSLAYWQEIGQCGRDGRDSYAICYAYKMLISKLQNKEFKELVDLDSCIRTHILQTLLLDGMDGNELTSLKNHVACSEECNEICSCTKGKCCIVCQKSCQCKGKEENPLKHFVN